MRRREFLMAAASDMRLRPAGGEWLKPFLYPLRTVSGLELSRGWPVMPRVGDSQDHAWHRGLWWGHGLINGVDFWREQGREKSGRIEGQQLVTPSGEKLGSVRQAFKIRDDGGFRHIDALITLRADQRQPLTFGDTDDGGFGIRLREEFREDRGAVIRNAEDRRGTKAVWGKPSRWVDYACQVEGRACGVVIFDHPRNFRHPTPWHARGYGLNAANPFAWKSFDKGVAEGKHVIPAGGGLQFRYRVVLYEQALDGAEIERRYREWSGA